MVMLAVNERSESIARITLDSLPDVEYRAAGRVDHHAPDLTQNLEVGDGNSERRQDHDVLSFDAAKIDVASRFSRFPLPASPFPLLRH